MIFLFCIKRVGAFSLYFFLKTPTPVLQLLCPGSFSAELIILQSWGWCHQSSLLIKSSVSLSFLSGTPMTGRLFSFNGVPQVLYVLYSFSFCFSDWIISNALSSVYSRLLLRLSTKFCSSVIVFFTFKIYVWLSFYVFYLSVELST